MNVLPSHDDPLVRVGSEAIGGPVGSHALLGTSWLTPLRVLMVLVFAASALGVVADQPCRSHAFGNGVTNYTHLCYTDIVPLWYERGLSTGKVPYFSGTTPGIKPVEYPVLTGALMWATAKVVPEHGDAATRARRYFDVNVLVAAVLAAVTVWATALTARRRRWDAAMVAVAPGLVLASTVNWDLLAVALTSLALLAWSRRYPVTAGALLGLAVAAKFYPVLVLGPLLLLCLRAGRLKAWLVTALAAAGAWLAVNLPVMAGSYDSWVVFYRMNRERSADLGSLWLVVTQRYGDIPVAQLNRYAELLFAGACVGVAVLALAARRRPRLPQLVFLAVAAFLLVNKVYSPQYVLWLIPLAALARPRWRDFLIWQAGEVVYFVAVWWYLQGYTDPSHALVREGYWLAIGIRVATTVYLMAVVVRDVLWPEHDPVRRVGDDDPAGGVLDEAADRFTLRRRARRDQAESGAGVLVG